MTLRILPRAVRYLAELRTTIAADDPEIAQKVGDRIIKALLLIEERPDIGRPTAGRESVRECAVPDLPYFIPYRVKDGNIEVLASITQGATARRSGRPPCDPHAYALRRQLEIFRHRSESPRWRYQIRGHHVSCCMGHNPRMHRFHFFNDMEAALRRHKSEIPISHRTNRENRRAWSKGDYSRNTLDLTLLNDGNWTIACVYGGYNNPLDEMIDRGATVSSANKARLIELGNKDFLLSQVEESEVMVVYVDKSNEAHFIHAGNGFGPNGQLLKQCTTSTNPRLELS